MSKKDPPKPIFPLKHEFYAGLDNYIHQSGMLADSVRTLLGFPGAITNDGVRTTLQERLDAFDEARHGDVGRMK